MAASLLDPAVHQSLIEKVLKYDTVEKGFACLYCKVNLTGEESAKEHLKSKLHREVGGKYAIMNLETSPASIRTLLPNTVLDAAKAKEISVKDSKILCHVCNMENTGIISAEAHLMSKNHMKKKYTGIPDVATVQIEQLPNLNYNFKDPGVLQAIKEKIVVRNDPNNLHCIVCDSNFNGELSLKQHLDSKRHEEEYAKLVIVNIAEAPRHLVDKLPGEVIKATRANLVELVPVNDSRHLLCKTCNVTASGVSALNSHLTGTDHRKKAQSLLLTVCTENKNEKDSNAFSHATTEGDIPPDSISEIDKAKREGIIDETDDVLNKFCCRYCDKKFSSDGPLLDHLRSKKHINNINKKKTCPDSRSSNQETGALPMRSSPPGSRYSVISDVRGHVYVFNYTFKGTTSARRGAEFDSANLKETFGKMGYDVFLHEDLTKKQTEECLERLRRSPDLHDIDAFIVFFLSHGLDEYTILANDSEQMDLRSMQRKFTDRKCPHLRGKPKIFMVNYCRGNEIERKDVLEFDSLEVPNDMVAIHAAAEGIMAKRMTTQGTVFVFALCEVLKKHAKEQELRDIYYLLREKMKENGGTKPMWVDYGFKSFYFNPADL